MVWLVGFNWIQNDRSAALWNILSVISIIGYRLERSAVWFPPRECRELSLLSALMTKLLVVGIPIITIFHCFVFCSQELEDIKSSSLKSFRDIIIDDANILIWTGLIVPVNIKYNFKYQILAYISINFILGKCSLQQRCIPDRNKFPRRVSIQAAKDLL